VVAGDFNASVHWDESGRYEPFSAVNAALAERGLESVYHARTGEPLGQEKSKTLFWRKDVETAFHIDYVYASADLVRSATDMRVEDAASWLPVGDHAPVIVDLEI
jgi:endonuclease/exonuclease/phosphatase family metal-dependent hydrolase